MIRKVSWSLNFKDSGHPGQNPSFTLGWADPNIRRVGTASEWLLHTAAEATRENMLLFASGYSTVVKLGVSFDYFFGDFFLVCLWAFGHHSPWLERFWSTTIALERLARSYGGAPLTRPYDLRSSSASARHVQTAVSWDAGPGVPFFFCYNASILGLKTLWAATPASTHHRHK